MSNLLIDKFHLAGFEGFFIEVIQDAKNFRTSGSQEMNYTEIVFDDPTNYCLHEDAPMFEGVYEINGRITKENKEYVVITKTHFPETEYSYEERIKWYHSHLSNYKKLELPSLEELLEKYKDQNIDYLPIGKFVERIPRYHHEDSFRKKKRPRL